jgi:hypothetical protein
LACEKEWQTAAYKIQSWGGFSLITLLPSQEAFAYTTRVEASFKLSFQFLPLGPPFIQIFFDFVLVL